MDPNVFADDRAAVLDRVLAGAERPAYVVDPTGALVAELVEVVEVGVTPELRVLSDARRLRRALDDFVVGAGVADLVRDEAVAIRTTDDLPPTGLVVTDDAVTAVVTAGERVAGLAAAETGFVAEATESYAERWAGAEAFDLRTPAISGVRDSLADELGSEVEAEFSAILGSLETARGDGDDLDEVTVSLLAAARHGTLFYDVSRWGERAGVASKATFSRVKNELEDAGLIATEKVPVDVGRPRQRLAIGDRRLAEADPERVAAVAQSLLD